MTVNVPHDLYPFEGKYLDVPGARMHYLDEGEGEPMLMVHGNPTWSFYWRDVVLRFRDRFRCVVPDHVGMGMSDKPGDDAYPYTLARRVDDLTALVEHLDLRDVTLCVHDWGGMIGFAWAVRNPERVKRLVVLNTAAFSLPDTATFPWALRLTRTPLGAGLVRGANAFSRTATHVCTTRTTLPKRVRDAYAAPYGTWADRIATLRFVQDIPLGPGDEAWSTVQATADALPSLAHLPMLICWGLRDFVFDRHFLAEWQRRFPNADVHAWEDGGHYILEDYRDDVLDLIEQLVQGTS